MADGITTSEASRPRRMRREETVALLGDPAVDQFTDEQGTRWMRQPAKGQGVARWRAMADQIEILLGWNADAGVAGFHVAGTESLGKQSAVSDTSHSLGVILDAARGAVDRIKAERVRSQAYGEILADAIGTTEPAMLALVDDFMRGDHGTLDALTADEFEKSAHENVETLAEWAYNGPSEASGGLSLRDYCVAMGMEFPRELTKIENHCQGPAPVELPVEPGNVAPRGFGL